MPIEPKYPEEGSPFSSADLNTLVQKAEVWINNVPKEDLERETFMEDHLPPFLERGEFPNGMSVVSYPRGLTSRGGSGLAAFAYNTRLGPDLNPCRDYQAFSADGVNAPYGPYDGVNVSLGWRILAHDGNGDYAVGTEAEITVTPTDLTGVFGLHAKAEVESLQTRYSSVNDEIGYYSAGVRIAVGWEATDGSRYIIERSVRHASVKTSTMAPIATSTLIKAGDIPAGLTLLRVFVAVSGGSVRENLTDVDPTLEATGNPRFGNYALNLFPVRA